LAQAIYRGRVRIDAAVAMAMALGAGRGRRHAESRFYPWSDYAFGLIPAMMEILESIAALEKAIHEAKTIEDVEHWWTWCEKIENSITFDQRATKQEKHEVARLKQAAGNAILYMRKTSLFPDRHLIGAVLTGLRISIESRTTGPDGWPLRK
jgi:hypothetical protein